MKRYNSTLIKMTRRLGMAIAALLMLSTMASCSDQDSQAPATGDEAYLNLSFSTASNTTSRASRAGDIGNDETQANPNQESDIHSIKVWVFKSGTKGEAKPIAYKEDNTPTAVGGGTANGNYTLNLRFLRKINGEELKNIDLYILANSESTNMADKLKGKDFRSITRADLQGVTFDEPFGITSEGKAQTREVPNGKGLPISRAITNIEIAKHVADTEIEAKDKGISIPLVRAVSKLHFYFARTADADALTENVKVTKIEIDGNTFPTESYVFPDEEDYATADANKAATSNKYGTPSYVSTLLKLDGVENAKIKAVADPLTYKRDEKTETAQTYMDRMNKEIGEHNLSYLRETNKPIKGKIYYQLAEGGVEKSRGFTIPSEGNAIRNRELVVYGYFLQGGALCLDWQVMPWNKVTSEISWNNVNCQMYAWQTGSTLKPKGGDAEGLYCLVNYPRYKDTEHEILEDKKSGAAYYFKVESPAGLVWKAHLTNPDEFAFNYGESNKGSTKCVSTGIARKDPYQIKVEAVNPWTTNASWDQLTPWAKDKGSNPVYTDLYVTVSLDGIHEYEVEINPDNAGGMYQKGRKFAGTNTRIRIFQLQATQGTAYDKLQSNSGHYTNYLIIK
jgi:putative surface protein